MQLNDKTPTGFFFLGGWVRVWLLLQQMQEVYLFWWLAKAKLNSFTTSAPAYVTGGRGIPQKIIIIITVITIAIPVPPFLTNKYLLFLSVVFVCQQDTNSLENKIQYKIVK